MLTSQGLNDQIKLIITCEHGGNEIPAPYINSFIGHEDTLLSHKGWDPGALNLAKSISDQLNLTLYFSSVSRLLVELNRSLHHRNLFSFVTREFNKKEKKKIIEEFYQPYRKQVGETIGKYINEGKTVIHLSIHSFTPIFEGVVRNCDIGFLYDPGKKIEKEWVSQWKKAFEQINPEYRVRLNYPYKGTADGFTTYLRKIYSEYCYAGIEVEVNQSILMGEKAEIFSAQLINSLKRMNSP